MASLNDGQFMSFIIPSSCHSLILGMIFKILSILPLTTLLVKPCVKEYVDSTFGNSSSSSALIIYSGCVICLVSL